MSSILSEKGVTWENYNTPKHLFSIGSILLENFPDVLEEASNIDIAELKTAPLEVIVQILEKVISVNMKSKDILEKNFKSLYSKFIPETQDLKQEVQKQMKKIKKK